MMHTRFLRDERGFSLIELLTSTVIMLIVLSLASRSLMDATKADDAIALMADANQNLQSSSTMMVRDLVDTGRDIVPGGLEMPNGNGVLRVVRPGPAETTAAGWPSAVTMYALTPGRNIGPVLNGAATDSVTLIMMDDRIPDHDVNVAVDAGNTRATLTLAAGGEFNTNVFNTYRVGDLVVLGKDNRNATVRITAVDDDDDPRVLTAATAGDTMRFNQFTAAAGSAKQVTGNGKVRRLLMVTYWVQEENGVPYLMRQTYDNAPVEVGLGVSYLRLAYDVNTGGGVLRKEDPIAEGYSPNELEKALLTLSVRSERPMRNSNKWMRNDTTTQVALRSLQLKKNFEFAAN
jgi:prepilin-type N-terminal cleavage/methylation domain-containing protein